VSAPIDQDLNDTATPLRQGMLILLVGFAGFLLWAGLAPMDEGLPSSGVLAVESKRKLISHPTGGVVSAIEVREAQAVEAGQVLLRLDDTQTRAAWQAAVAEQLALLAAQARLQAEQQGAAELVFPAAFETPEGRSAGAVYRQTQLRLFQARRAALASDMAVLAEAERSQQDSAANLASQQGLLSQEMSGLKDLAGEGYVPRNQFLQVERQHSEVTRAGAQATAAAQEARLRRTQREREFAREVEAELAQVRRELGVVNERVTSLATDLARTEIRSPVTGYVNGLGVHTIGGVVGAGERLLEVVPAQERLVFEVRIAPQLIDKVRAGLPANINLYNFPDTPNLVLAGKVLTVSHDLLPVQSPQEPPYYGAAVEVTPEGMATLGDRQLQAGMHADVVIRTGERSLLVYLFKPLLRRFDGALLEP
jgi:membrane fusion protein, protease secretion system